MVVPLLNSRASSQFLKHYTSLKTSAKSKMMRSLPLQLVDQHSKTKVLTRKINDPSPPRCPRKKSTRTSFSNSCSKLTISSKSLASCTNLLMDSPSLSQARSSSRTLISSN